MILRFIDCLVYKSCKRLSCSRMMNLFHPIEGDDFLRFIFRRKKLCQVSLKLDRRLFIYNVGNQIFIEFVNRVVS